jgi:prephenate dehydrogenase
MIDKNTRFLIVGLGLIGGSYATALKKKGRTVWAIDTDPAAIDYAQKQGLIDRGATYPDHALIGKADVIIFALYPHAMISWIQAHQHLFAPGVLLTDVAGVKNHVVDVIQKDLRPDVEFLGSHPMAGREVSGVQNSSDVIFAPANFIITPTEKNTPDAIAALEELAGLLGFAHIVTLSPKEHDEIIGFVSQLTHVIAVCLMNCNDNPCLNQYTGDSFRDLTRIARINENLWSELFLMNREVLINEIDAFVGEVENLKSKLAAADAEGLKKLFIQSTQRRKHFDKT